MPIYTYRCKECDHLFEKFIRNMDSEAAKRNECPECGGESPRSFEGHSIYRNSLDEKFQRIRRNTEKCTILKNRENGKRPRRRLKV